MKDRYYIYRSVGFSRDSIKELESNFAKQGLESYKPDGLGGGPDEIIQEIIIWVKIHSFWSSLFIGILANRIDKIIDKISTWLKEYRIPGKDRTKYILEIKIGKGKVGYNISFDLNKKYTKNEIQILLKEVKN